MSEFKTNRKAPSGQKTKSHVVTGTKKTLNNGAVKQVHVGHGVGGGGSGKSSAKRG